MINLVIPAAGAATRLRPLSSNTSKVMVRVNGKPCLDYIIEQAKKLTEIAEVIIVDGEFNDIRNYTERRYSDLNVRCVKQGSLNGPRDAISVGINSLSDASLPLVVWLGDAIILEDDLPLGTDFLLTKEVEDQSAWCMWDGSNFYNKPQTIIPNSTALVGLYSFKDGDKAKEAFTVDAYDISDALVKYGSNYKNINTNRWYDIGDLPTYYQTCAELLNLKSRDFNNLEYNADLGTIRKFPDYHKSDSVEAISNERKWYNELTPEQSMFVPRILKNSNELIMSYESGILLSDLMLYENLSEAAWNYIIDKVFKIKLTYFNSPSSDELFLKYFSDNSERMWVDKCKERLTQVNFGDNHAKITNYLMEASESIYKKTQPIATMHGDLHFGNILYNQQTNQITLIDPRGKYGAWEGTNGDHIYDFAKLAHDLFFGYNAMVSNVDHNKMVQKIFINKLKEYNLDYKTILKGGLLLLATCIPLHYDDKKRQDRFKKKVIEYVEKHCI